MPNSTQALRPLSVLVAAIAPILLMSACATSITSPQDSTNANTVTYYTSKTSYQPRDHYRHYSRPPAGYELISIQHVARHGSRGLSSPDSDDLVLQLWLQAQRERALTQLGLELGPAVIELMNIHHQLGYGQLSGLGQQEHRQIAERVIVRHQQELAELDALKTFGVMHSGRLRASQSGEAFMDGWLAIRPNDNQRFLPSYANKKVVYFHSAEGSEGYDAYKEGPRVAAILNNYLQDGRTQQASHNTLMALFSSEFVQRLAQGEYEFNAYADPSDKVTNAEEAALAIYDLFAIATNLSEEHAPDFTRFVPVEARDWFAEIDDADSFYGRGPGFADEDISFAAAEHLVRDMYERAQAVAAGKSNEFAMFRFTHAQALMPVATWLGLPNATQAAEAGIPYSYTNNPWRAALISPMSANIQWDIYQNKDGHTLVRMLWNEAETSFAAQCTAFIGSFYTLDEIANCYSL